MVHLGEIPSEAKNGSIWYVHIIRKGQYRGFLVLRQHRYFSKGGSLDQYRLFTPLEKEKGHFLQN